MNRSSAMLINNARRLHLQHGPIDLIIDAQGHDKSCRDTVFHAAANRFDTVLDEVVHELDALRAPFGQNTRIPSGKIARRMYRATKPHRENFVTMMACVAGAVADEVLDAMIGASATLTRAYVNNGGDIAIFLGQGQIYKTAIGTLQGGIVGHISIGSADGIRGIATSGQGGRSLSMGIAECVTVVARNAADADVAATLIANAVDLPGHPAILRHRACDLDPDSDLGNRQVVYHVPPLSAPEIETALEAGQEVAQTMKDNNLIAGCALFLGGHVRIIGAIEASITEERARYA